MSKYKVGDMYAPKSIFLAVVQMVKQTDPVRRVYEELRKNPMDFNAPRKICMVMPNSVYLEGVSCPVTFDIMDSMFNPVYVSMNEIEAPENKDIITPSAFKKMMEKSNVVEKTMVESNAGGEIVPRENSSVVLDKFFKVAHQVKKRTKSDVVHHLSAEVGEISECLVQPQRGGNIVEESVDAIVCALDVIYLELNITHGTAEIAQVINKLLDKKLDKWYRTCKPE